MAESLAAIGNEAHRAALYAERNGDLTEAVRQYRIAWGAVGSLSRTAKGDVELEFDPRNLQAKIKDVDDQIAKASGAGKLRRINVHHRQPSSCDCD